jgi:hypothetical protein
VWMRFLGNVFRPRKRRDLLLRYNVHRHWDRMRRQTGTRIAGLVVKATLQYVLALLRREVGVENKLSRIDTEFLLRSNLEGILRSRREVDCSDVKPRWFDHRQSGPDQRLLRGMVRINVETIGHAKMKINLGGPLSGNVDLFGRKKLDSILRGQRQRLVLEDLQPKKHQDKANHYPPPVASAFLMLASTSLFETNPAVSATILPSRPTK